MNRILRILILGAIMASASTAWASGQENGPRAVIESTVNNIIRILDERRDKTRVSEAARQKIRAVVEGRFDYRAMARRSLGRPWKQLDADEQQHFTEVFRELLERSYGNRLNEYKGQKVVFEDAEIRKNKARVRSTVIDEARQTPVEYRLHKTDNGWQVYDIRIEGASMIGTFHQDFKSILDSGGYAKLLKTLEDKIARLKSREQA